MSNSTAKRGQSVFNVARGKENRYISTGNAVGRENEICHYRGSGRGGGRTSCKKKKIIILSKKHVGGKETRIKILGLTSFG